MNKDQTELMMQEADQYLDVGNLTSALSVYSKILKIDPQHDEACAMMGSVHGELGNIDLAMKSLDKALHLNPENADAWLMQGMIYRSIGKKESALISLNSAAKYASDYDVAHFNLTELLQDMGRSSEAINTLNQFIFSNVDHIEARHKLGKLYQSLGDHKGALNCFKSILKLKPAHLESLRCVPIEQLALGDINAAEEFSLNAISLQPNDPWLYKNLSNVRLEQVRLTEAVEYAKKASGLAPSNLELLLYFADLVEKRGDYEEVLEILRPLLERKAAVCNAVILFAKFALYLDMSRQAEILIKRLIGSGETNPQQLEILNKALIWNAQKL